jgi:hypothetical protein
MGNLAETAMGRLTPEQQDQAVADVRAYLAHLAKVLAAARRGVRIAPAYRRPLAEQLKAEGDRRAQLSDRTWIVWDALAVRDG